MATSTKDLARALDDVSAYPLQVTDALAGSGSRGGPGDDLDRLVDGALRAVIGTRTRVEDVDRFRAALASSFVEEEVDGHRRFVPASPGGLIEGADESAVSGAQAGLLAQAKDVAERGLPLLGRIASLHPASDQQDQDALCTVIRTAVEQLRAEFGRADGPRAPLVDQQLQVLLGGTAGGTTLVDPDQVEGALGALRDLAGLASRPVLPLAGRNGHAGNRANTAAEEESLTHFRVLTEYVLRLWQSWRSFAGSHDSSATGYAFIGGRLAHLDLTFQTVGEAVDRVRNALDSVYVGPAERQVLVLPLPSRPRDRLSVEQLLDWAEQAVGRQTANLARDHGRIALAEYVLPNVSAVAELLAEAASVDVGGGFGTPRVRSALAELVTQYGQLVDELALLAPPPRGSGFPGAPHTEMVQVPDLLGRKLARVGKALRKDGLEFVVGQGQAVRSGKRNRVLATSPAPGTWVPRGSTVTVDYSATLAQTLVPSVRGLTVGAAEDRLEDADLRLGELRYQDSREVPPGHVIRSNPPAATVLPVREQVDLRVSRGDGRGDLVDRLCGVAPVVGEAARQVLDATSRLWQAGAGAGDDCGDELRNAVTAVGNAVLLLRGSVPRRQQHSARDRFDPAEVLEELLAAVTGLVDAAGSDVAEETPVSAVIEDPGVYDPRGTFGAHEVPVVRSPYAEELPPHLSDPDRAPEDGRSSDRDDPEGE